MATEPIDILSKVHKDGFTLSVFAIFDVLLIALMFFMLSSKYILASGISVDLNSEINLPEVPKNSMGGAFAEDSISVLNIRGSGMIFFGGKVFNEEAFAREIKNYKPRGEVLLVKTDAGVSGQTLLNISVLAKEAGFKSIQIAATSK